MHKNKLLVLTVIACGLVLGWSLAFALRDSPTLRILWMIALGATLVTLWRLCDGV